jgi:hypothetical protein
MPVAQPAPSQYCRCRPQGRLAGSRNALLCWLVTFQAERLQSLLQSRLLEDADLYSSRPGTDPAAAEQRLLRRHGPKITHPNAKCRLCISPLEFSMVATAVAGQQPPMGYRWTCQGPLRGAGMQHGRAVTPSATAKSLWTAAIQHDV